MGKRTRRAGVAACAMVLVLGWSGRSRGDITADATLTDGGVQSTDLFLGFIPIGSSFTQTTTDFDVSAFPAGGGIPVLTVDASGLVFQLPAIPAGTAITGATLSLDVTSTDGVPITVAAAAESSGTLDPSEFGTGTPVTTFTPVASNPNTVDVTAFFTSLATPTPFVFFELDPTFFVQDTEFTAPALTLQFSAVPEPSSLALGAVGGAVAIGAAARRLRRKPAAA